MSMGDVTAILRAGPTDLCAKCSGFMVPGIALAMTLVESSSGEGTMNPGPKEIIACHKCRDCGWSVTSWHGIDGKPGKVE